MMLSDKVDGHVFGLGPRRGVDEKDKFKPKIDKSRRVERYRPGQAPAWVKEEDESDVSGVFAKKQRKRRKFAATLDDDEEEVEEEREVRTTKRRRRKFTAQVVEDEEEEQVERPKRSRRKFTAQIEDDDDEQNETVESKPVESVSVEDDDEIASRRARIRAKILERRRREAEDEEQKQQEEEEQVEEIQPKQEEEGEEEEESGSSSSYESGSSEEEEEGMMIKPVFVPKSQRKTRNRREEERIRQEQLMEEKEMKNLERAERTRQMVVDEIRLDQLRDERKDEEDMKDMPNDEDNEDEDAFEAWKLRELGRIKTYRDQSEVHERERRETERRRNMTDEERRRDNERLEREGIRVSKKKNKKQRSFLQKYYHKGAFYMDEDSIKDKDDVRLKDYDEATGDDKFNKKALPKILQKRNFGKKNQTKYTHLADQDTTSKDDLWAQQPRDIQRRSKQKMAGVHGHLDNAGRKRKKR